MRERSEFLRLASHLSILTLLLGACAPVLAQSQQPSPAIRVGERRPPTEEPKADESQPGAGSETNPAFVRITKSPREAADDQQDRNDEASARWWTVRLTGLLVLIAAVQAIVYWVQAKRLKDTIEKMDEIAKGQTGDMRDSITEATRSAQAMEGIAESLAASNLAMQDTIKISSDMAENQRFVFELANRAWLFAKFAGMRPQVSDRGLEFQPRIRIVNNGTTPAYDVHLIAAADVIPFPVSPNFEFPLEEPTHGSVISTLVQGADWSLGASAPQMYPEDRVLRIRSGRQERIALWGTATYTDAFKKKRHLDFAFSYFQDADGDWISQDMGMHSRSD